jgi:hypothetical protein
VAQLNEGTMKRLALTLALTVAGILPAAAQYGYGYYYPQGQGYGRGYDDGYGRRRGRDDGYVRRGREYDRYNRRDYDRRSAPTRPGYGYTPPRLENDIPYNRRFGR